MLKAVKSEERSSLLTVWAKSLTAKTANTLSFFFFVQLFHTKFEKSWKYQDEKFGWDCILLGLRSVSDGEQ